MKYSKKAPSRVARYESKNPLVNYAETTRLIRRVTL